jgi:hypothetical protein
MVKASIIGKGKFGTKIENCIKEFVQFVRPEDADWIIISTPNDLHYEQVEYWLSQRKNVFCEKPLTLTVDTAKELFSLADFMGVKLYVDDVFKWYQHKNDLNWIECFNDFKWYKYGSFNANIVDNLAYHHFYLSELAYEKFEVEDVKVHKHYYDSHGLLKFTITVNNEVANYEYKIDHIGEAEHWINRMKVMQPANNPLQLMFENIFVDGRELYFTNNRRGTLGAIKSCEAVKKEVFPKVLVVGGGIFGTTAATMLATAGFNVTLHEELNGLLKCASGINQFRLHKGYHYPRSKQTAKECLTGLKTFKRKYESSVVNGNIEHYYAIADKESLTSPQEYLKFLVELNLEFDVVTPIKNTSLTLKVEEELFDSEMLRVQSIQKMRGVGVDVVLKHKTTKKDIEAQTFDYVIIATYSKLNSLLKSKRKYQFEVCEKPVVKLPDTYRNKSIVILDGPFMCLDPFKDEYHLLGHVDHAIHSRNVGNLPKVDKTIKTYLNKGIIRNPKVTKIKDFIEAGTKFFDGFDKLEHIGSMYTVRTVLADREYDDARPTIVKHEGQGIYTLFSGKVDTCVDAANILIKKLKGI